MVWDENLNLWLNYLAITNANWSDQNDGIGETRTLGTMGDYHACSETLRDLHKMCGKTAEVREEPVDLQFDAGKGNDYLGIVKRILAKPS